MIRPEMVCLAVLSFIQIYSTIYKKTTAKIFRDACWAAIVHLIFDAVTVITVNNLDTIPKTINDVCHFALYLSAMAFCQVYLDYIAAQVASNRQRRFISEGCRSLILLYVVAYPLMSIEYTVNPITNYSGGSACYVLMGTAYTYFLIAITLVFTKHKKLERSTFITSVSTTVFMMICVTLQLIIPTFLFAGCGITVVTLGMFFAVENPTKYYQQRAFIDISTGVKNKNCYDEDLKHLDKVCRKKESKITVAVCDLNNLKLTNDKYGHLSGDILIQNTADILSKYFRDEYNIYRIGGDEFLVFFINKDDKDVKKEISTIYNMCDIIDKEMEAPFSIAIGFASTEEVNDNEIQSVVALADKRMYSEKKRMKARRAELRRAESAEA